MEKKEKPLQKAHMLSLSLSLSLSLTHTHTHTHTCTEHRTFCMGETLQHTTLLALLHSLTKSSWFSFFSIAASAPPSITSPTFERPSGIIMPWFSISTSSSLRWSTCDDEGARRRETGRRGRS